MKFPKLITGTKAHIQGAQRIPRRSHTHTQTKPYTGMSYLKQIMLGKMSEETLSYAQRKKYKDYGRILVTNCARREWNKIF